MTSNSTVRTRLRALREARRLSQQQLADTAQVHISTIRRIEQGHFPQPDTVAKLAAALGLQIPDPLLLPLGAPLPSYPDEGHPLDDRSILRNAATFTSAQRTRSPFRIVTEEPLEELSPDHRALIAVDAFASFVLSTEDAIGWLLVLEKWAPGSVERSLFALLDKVNVNDVTDRRINLLLNSMTVPRFRKLVHVPNNRDLAELGWTSDELI